MDLVLDYTNPVPAVMTMRLMGLPCDNWAHYGEFFHAAVAYGPGTPEFEHANARVPDMMAELLGAAEGRRGNPGNDVLTGARTAAGGGRAGPDRRRDRQRVVEPRGRRARHDELVHRVALHHLGTHPDLRDRLIEAPALIGAAVEEYLRYFSVNETLSRTVSRDCELGGQHLKRGDRVLISWISANHDEAVFDHPEEVRFDRAPNPHLRLRRRPAPLHRDARRPVDVPDPHPSGTRAIPHYEIDVASTSFYTPNPSLCGRRRHAGDLHTGPDPEPGRLS